MDMCIYVREKDDSHLGLDTLFFWSVNKIIESNQQKMSIPSTKPFDSFGILKVRR